MGRTGPEARTIEACRARELMRISQINLNLGPNCDRPTLGLAYQVFDLGSFEGFWVADTVASAQMRVCTCVDNSCPEPMMTTAVADAHRHAAEIVDGANRGITEISTRYARHSCLDASLMAALYSTGFTCALELAKRDPDRRLHRAEDAVAVWRMPLESAQARELDCIK